MQKSEPMDVDVALPVVGIITGGASAGHGRVIKRRYVSKELATLVA